uniref:Uncharacterized protein n=1 Tax=Candidatus Kentrum sp. SD TaxID=2126332 RepID=A0A450YNZ4_9GAMM|nr:MAG: hypothetical protein BECKSD772F_GA0070984_11406 [Candidatus Kentron sp. SD]VFK48758.1 MAG: hypothetical protein BECKSD772E_GA0070983_11407 [Candidatus Kentron sp. SD]
MKEDFSYQEISNYDCYRSCESRVREEKVMSKNSTIVTRRRWSALDKAKIARRRLRKGMSLWRICPMKPGRQRSELANSAHSDERDRRFRSS